MYNIFTVFRKGGINMTEEQRDELLLSMSTKIDGMDQKFDKIDQRFEKIDQRFEKLEHSYEILSKGQSLLLFITLSK